MNEVRVGASSTPLDSTHKNCVGPFSLFVSMAPQGHRRWQTDGFGDLDSCTYIPIYYMFMRGVRIHWNVFANLRATFPKTSIRQTLPDLYAIILHVFPFAHSITSNVTVDPYTRTKVWSQCNCLQWNAACEHNEKLSRGRLFSTVSLRSGVWHDRRASGENSSSVTPGHLESGYMFYFVSLCSLAGCGLSWLTSFL